MENKQNVEQKKAWVTPELFNESVYGTESKPTYSMGESTFVGPS
jgi:hypothetical protein